MSSHLPRLVLGVLAVLTLLLSAGGAVGVWSVGAPASGGDVPAVAGGTPGAATEPRESLRPAAARLPKRVTEGPGGGPATHAEGTGTPEGQASDTSRSGASPEQDTAPPAGSGSGRRVVFDISAQQVWLVGPAGNVQRTYPVSGSRTDNLGPGRYEVYSRSRHAVSYTYEETMRYMVRFAYGEEAAIGFHDIPRDQQGDPVQTQAQLGERLSAGCIRQARPDARALWRFAHVGTQVVVVR
jgi:lipoprotein-anchoring transpeptidase ErfK/SrfK